ncbi:MAG: LptF/LptG family permease [Elusimicrobia bacterium]|nr:LptF/LptG family permease [Elusimicrobiota bacterium]
MKIICKYIIREFLEAFIFGLIIFSIILLLDQIIQLINLTLTKGISLWTVTKLFLLILPNILSLTIPMAVLFGILIGYGRISEDNEITALRSSGTNYKTLTSPILMFVILISILMIPFNHFLSPSLHKNFRQLYQKILSQRPFIRFEEKTITNIGEYRFYAHSLNKKNGVLKGVNIYKFSNQLDGAPWRINSSSATVMLSPSAVIFELYNGYWQNTNPNKPDTLINMHFSKYNFVIFLGGKVIPFSQSLREMTTPQLRKEIKYYQSKKMPSNFLENEFWLRWTMAFAPIVFAFIAIPLALISHRGGKSAGFGLSILVISFYYMILIIALNTGEKEYLPPKFILWLPNLAMLSCGIFFWKRMIKK